MGGICRGVKRLRAGMDISDRGSRYVFVTGFLWYESGITVEGDRGCKQAENVIIFRRGGRERVSYFIAIEGE